jgi:transcriptional regulator with XRE-family HTH domain
VSYGTVNVSALGALIRPARLALNLSQDAAARRLAQASGDPGFTNKRLSNIETGFRRPGETEQLALVEVLKIDLAALIAACDQDDAKRAKEKRNERERKNAQARRMERAAQLGRTIVPRTSAYRPADAVMREPAPRASPTPRAPQAKPRAQRYDGTEELIEALIEIVPMPIDADTRKAWFRCARELFRLSAGNRE